MARESKRKRDERRFGRPERLADMILEHGTVYFQTESWPDEAIEKAASVRASTLEMVRKATHIDAQNVAEYFHRYHFGKPELGKLAPNCMPPIEPLFVEYKQGQQDYMQGVIVTSHARGAVPGEIAAGLGSTLCENREWARIVLFQHVFSIYGVTPVGPLLTVMAPIDERGRMIANPVLFTRFGNLLSDQDRAKVKETGIVPMLVAMLTVSFMHCKGVVVEPRERNAALNRARRRASLKPFMRYHTIRIDPVREILKTEGGIEVDGLGKALHICRGHFANYESTFMGRKLDKPMMVWRPMHVRGNAKNGMVVSDYKVNPPQDEKDETHGQ